MNLKHAVQNFDEFGGRTVGFLPNRNERSQIEREGNKPLFFRFQAFHQSLARVSVAVKNGQTSAFERQRRGVNKSHSAHRTVAPHGFVINRNSFAVHFRLHNRNQRRTVVQNRNRLFDFIFKQIADFIAARRRRDARISAH